MRRECAGSRPLLVNLRGFSWGLGKLRLGPRAAAAATAANAAAASLRTAHGRLLADVEPTPASLCAKLRLHRSTTGWLESSTFMWH